MALLVFQVPLKGSFVALLLGVLVYVTATTAYGMLISAFARTQIAALFGTAILTVLPAISFAGMLVPVSGVIRHGTDHGPRFPMTYFLPISVGTFTKGLGIDDLAENLAGLAVFIPVLTAAQPHAAAAAGALTARCRSWLTSIWLGTKELRSFLHDFVLLGLVVYAFSLAIIAQAQGTRRRYTTRRSRLLTRTAPCCRGGSRRRFSRPIFNTRRSSLSATSTA